MEPRQKSASMLADFSSGSWREPPPPPAPPSSSEELSTAIRLAWTPSRGGDLMTLFSGRRGEDSGQRRGARGESPTEERRGAERFNREEKRREEVPGLSACDLSPLAAAAAAPSGLRGQL